MDDQRVDCLRSRVLRGDLSQDHVGRSVEIWRQPSDKLAVFISSTFTDTDRERNVLLEKILPDVRAEGRAAGIEVVFVDMRFGVRDENTLDHQTWIACKRELERCHRESAGIFFLSLQGDKYGYRPLPRALSRDVAEVALAGGKKNEEEEKEDGKGAELLFREWYSLDSNAGDRGQFILKTLPSLGDAEYWDVALPGLRDGCLSGVEFGEGTELLVGQSVTEWEARYALSLPGAAERSHWLHRTLDGGSASGLGWLDDGMSERLVPLKEHMRRHMQGRVEDASVPVASYVAKDDAWTAFLSDFETRARGLFRREMARVLAAKRQWAIDGCGVGICGEDLAEVLHHAQWACQKCCDFEGREDELKSALGVALGARRECGGEDELQMQLWGIDLTVVGKSGAGKTAFIAKLAQLLSEERPNRPVLVRFCGTSRGSTTGLAMVQSLCRQMEYCFQIEAATALGGFEQWVKYFHSLLAAHAVVVLIDSLDQLTDDDDARSGLTFLKGLTAPHPDTRVIVSCLPDETDALTGKRYFYGCETRLREAQVPRVDILPLEAGGAVEMVRQLLVRRGRGLTAEQWGVVGASIIDLATALYCHLAVRVTCAWTSSLALEQCVLPPTVPAIIHLIFEGVEREFGREWVPLALACLTFSRAGLSDGEMQDILSLDDDRVLNHVFQYSRPDQVRRFPLHVWLRLKGGLQGLLVEREGGCSQWYHRQLKETAEARYAGLKEFAHMLLGKYFGDLCGDRGAERLVTKQSLCLNGKSLWHPAAQVNTRRCVEAPHHLVAAGVGMVEQACRELCSVELVCACAKAGQAFELLKAMLALEGATGGRVKRVGHYVRWLLNDASEMTLDPQHLVAESCFRQPSCAATRQDLERMINAADRHSMQDMTAADWSSAWTVGQPLGGRREFDSCVMTLRGHSQAVNAVCISRCGCLIGSASGDKAVRIWDFGSGDCLSTLLGHGDSVTSAAFITFKGSQTMLISGSRDWTIRLWDLETRSCVSVLRGHVNNVNAVVPIGCGELVCSGSGDKTLRLWNLLTSECVSVLEGHDQYVGSVAAGIRNGGAAILSGSGDSTVRLWDGRSGELVKTLALHSASVRSVAWKESDYSRFVSGSEDWTARVWCAATLQCLSTLQGHSSCVRCVAWSPALSSSSELDDDVLVTGSYDGTLRTWAGAGKCTSVLTGHSGYVLAAAYSPVDGCRLVSGSVDCSIRVFECSKPGAMEAANADDQDEVDEDQAASSASTALAIAVSPDCRFAACSSCREPAVRVWSAVSGECTGTLLGAGAPGSVVSLAWTSPSPSAGGGGGEYLVAGTSDRLLLLWDAHAPVASQLLRVQCHDGPVVCVATLWVNKGVRLGTEGEGMTEASTEQLLIVTGSEDRSVKVWAWAEGGAGSACLANLLVHSAAVKSVCFAGPDHVLSGAWDNTLRLSCWRTGGCVLTFEGHTACVNAIAFCPTRRFPKEEEEEDGAAAPSRIASGGMDGSLRVWREADGACLGVLRGHTNYLLGVAWGDSDGRILCSSAGDKSIRLWDAVLFLPLHTLSGHSANVLAFRVDALAHSPSSMRVVSAAEDNSVRVSMYHFEEHHVSASSSECESTTSACTTTSASTTAASGGRSECLSTVRGRIGSIARSVAVALQNKGTTDAQTQIVTGSGDNLVQVWGCQSAHPASACATRSLPAVHSDYVVAVAVASDGDGEKGGSLVFSGSGDTTVGCWLVGADGGECVSVLAGHASKVTSVACNASGSLVVSGSLDGTVRAWDHVKGACLAVLQHSSDLREVLAVAVSRDGRCIASGGSDCHVRLFESGSGAGSWESVASMQGHSGWIHALTFDDASRLVSGSADASLKLWECQLRGRRRASAVTLQGHTGAVRTAAWGPNSAVVVSGADDCTLRVWGFRDKPVCLAVLHMHTFLYVVALSWLPGGEGVVTTSGDNSVRVWRALAHRSLDAGETEV